MAFVRLYTIDEVACLFREYQHMTEERLSVLGIDLEISKIKSSPNTVTIGELFIAYLSRDIIKHYPQPISQEITAVLHDIYANFRTIGGISTTGDDTVVMPLYEYHYKIGVIHPDDYYMLKQEHEDKPWEDVPMWHHPVDSHKNLKAFYKWFDDGLKIHRYFVKSFGRRPMDVYTWVVQLKYNQGNPDTLCPQILSAYDYFDSISKDNNSLKLTAMNPGGSVSKPVFIEKKISKFQLK